MSRFRFVHTADLHLDSPFRGVSRFSLRAAETLVDATFQAFDAVVELCRREGVDALLVAGDVYDRGERSLRAEWLFRDRLASLARDGVSCFVVHGNHDPLFEKSLRASAVDGVHVFGPDVSSVPLVRDGRELAIVHGMSHDRSDVRENLALRFRRSPSNAFSIGLLHANVGGRDGHEPYAPCSLDDLSAAGMDYWALGHVHTCEILRDRTPVVAYPGNTQGLNPREEGPRGCFLVDVEDGVARPRFVPTDVVRWAGVEVAIDDIATRVDLARRVEEAVSACVEGAEGRSVIARLLLTGRGLLHGEVTAPGALRPLCDELERKLGDGRPFVLVDPLPPRTRPEVDREEILLSPTLSGEVWRLADEARREGDLARYRDAIAPLAGKLTAARVPFAAGDATVLDWIERAAALAHDQLDEEVR